MQVPTIFKNANVPWIQKKKGRRPRIAPLAAGIAGGGAIALVAYKKRSAVTGRSTGSTGSAAEPELGEFVRHVADMVALDQGMAKSLRKQPDGVVILPIPQARPILELSADAFEQQASELEDEIGSRGGGPLALIKKFLGAAGSAVAPMIGASRSEAVSRTLRDDAVGLRLAAISSSMLQTAAKAEGNGNVARIAGDGSDSFTQLAEELEGVLPDAVTMEYEQRQDQAPDSSTTNDSAAQVDLAFAPANRSIAS